jgi:hypothetical protein
LRRLVVVVDPKMHGQTYPGEKSNHLTEIYLVPNLCQGEIEPLFIFYLLCFRM